MKKNILVVVNQSNKDALIEADNLKVWAESQGFYVRIVGGLDIENNKVNGDDISKFAVAVVLGGDGTVLKTAHLVGNFDIPILGINYGHLGFLTNKNTIGSDKLLNLFFSGKLQVEVRSHIKVCISTDVKKYEFIALNEATFKRNNSGKIINLDLYINNQFIYNLQSDGIITSTSTGSTAYSLSAGGPIMSPSYRGIIVVPLSPHTLNTRPLITDSKSVVEIDFNCDTQRESICIYIDGKLEPLDGAISRVAIFTKNNETKILRYESDNFYKKISKIFFN